MQASNRRLRIERTFQVCSTYCRMLNSTPLEEELHQFHCQRSQSKWHHTYTDTYYRVSKRWCLRGTMHCISQSRCHHFSIRVRLERTSCRRERTSFRPWLYATVKKSGLPKAAFRLLTCPLPEGVCRDELSGQASAKMVLRRCVPLNATFTTLSASHLELTCSKVNIPCVLYQHCPRRDYFST